MAGVALYDSSELRDKRRKQCLQKMLRLEEVV